MTVSEDLDRHAVIEELQELDTMERNWIRNAVLEARRLDVLAEQVLGFELKPFHRALQRFALCHPHSLQLAFRGAGKTTTCTVVLAIFHILRNPNVRILIASKTHEFAKDVLKEIKGHLDGNDRLTEIFGPQRGEKWDTSQIEVQGRTRPMKEPTITTVGSEGQIVGKHYDVILADDLVDESNSKTAYMRDSMRTFFYKTLMPTLEPGGELHIYGTRYHYDDLYGHLSRNEMEETTQVIPALDEHERSPWPEKFSAEFFKKLRASSGTIIFDSQYRCNTDAMKGEIFEIDWMVECDAADVPADARLYIGCDPAISEKEQSDLFAICLIAISGRTIYIVKTFAGHLTFGRQVAMLVDWYNEHDPVEMAIEGVAYQAALYQHLRDNYEGMRVCGIGTSVDKVTRAWKLSARFEADEVRIVRGANPKIIEHLVLFPGFRYKDLFDALDLAVTVGYRRRRRSGRSKEVGLL